MNAYLRQTEPTMVTLLEHEFYIFPFPAFKASNVLGDLTGFLLPTLAQVLPAAMMEDVFDKPLEEIAPLVGKGLQGISGDAVEKLLKKLLTQKNISVELEGEETPQYLTESLADSIFCGNAQELFVLAYHVIRINFAGFFDKLASLSGKVMGEILKTSNNTESSI